MKEVSIESIIDNIDKLDIIDIRENYLYNLGKIPNAINIPMNFLIMNPKNYLDKDKTYYIYCSKGLTSKMVCVDLINKGYDVINIIDGYNGYTLYTHLTR